MATLKELVKKSGLIKSTGGISSTTSDEELQSLSGATGRAAAPISPLGAKMLGANPDQVKMAGADANKASALNASVSGNLSLRDTIRQTQASTQKTDAERINEEKQKSLQGLTGALDKRVQAIAEAKLGGNIANSPTILPGNSVSSAKVASLFPTLAGPEQAEMTKNIQNAITTPGDLTSVMAVAKGLGLDAASMSADALIAQVNKTLLSEEESLVSGGEGKGLAGLIDNDIKMSDVFSSPDAMEALGDPANLAQDLGLSESDFLNLDMGAFKKKMEEMGLKDFHSVADLQRRANDPYTSASERTALNKELLRLGASGVRGSEQEYSKIVEEVNSANTINIGGQEYTTEQALSDDNVQALIGSYLTDPEEKKKLLGTPLADFIERNKAVLTQASNNLSGNARALMEIKDKNASLAKTPNGTPVGDSIMKALFPTWGELSSTKIDTENNAAYKNLMNLQKGTQDAVISSLSGVKDSEIINTLLTTDSGVLDGLVSTKGLGEWINFRQAYDAAADLAPEAAISSLLGGTSLSSYQDALSEYRNAAKAGVLPAGFDVPLANILDADKDGIMDNPNTIKAALMQKFADAANTPPSDRSGIPDPKKSLDMLNELAPKGGSVYGIIRDYIKGDGFLDTNDATKLLSSPAAAGGREADLQGLLASPALTYGARETITKELTRRSLAAFTETVLNPAKESIARVGDLRALVANPSKIPSARLQGENEYFVSMQNALSGMIPYVNKGSPTDQAVARQTVSKMINSIPDSTLRQLDKKKFLNDILSGTDFSRALSSASAQYKDGLLLSKDKLVRKS